MGTLFDNIGRAASYIQCEYPTKPQVGVILGTGLGSLARGIVDPVIIPYDQIPHFPLPTVECHQGRLVCGRFGSADVVLMEGRSFYYEGQSMQDITFPVRVMRALGCSVLVITNAAGAMNLSYQKGDLVILSDHINMMGENPLRGPNDERLGVRFPDMSEPYSQNLQWLAANLAENKGLPHHRGVYVAVNGPCLETRAEYRFLRQAGADVVGMSTVPDVIVAVHAGLRVLGISVVTDLCDPDHLYQVSIAEIIDAAQIGAGHLNVLLPDLLNHPDLLT